MIRRIFILITILLFVLDCDWNRDTDLYVPQSGVITFTTEGNSFSPLITLRDQAEILWTWDDGSTDTDVTNPLKIFSDSRTRWHTLKVTPWSALERINIGYGGEDGGNAWDNRFPPAELVIPNQKVSRVDGLSVAAPYLERWYSSNNSSFDNNFILDFTNFVSLTTVECYESSLNNVILKNTPNLQRLCLEDTNITGPLDLTESPALMDLRGALNNYDSILFGAGFFNALWHVCLRENYLNSQDLFADTGWMPVLGELLIMNMNQIGTLKIPKTGNYDLVYIDGSTNGYQGLDLEGALQDQTKMGFISIGFNQLSEKNQINLTGCVQITAFYAENNQLEQAAVDYILETLDNNGRSRDTDADKVLPPDLTDRENFVIDLTNLQNDPTSLQNDPPSDQGNIHKASLESKGWTVNTN